MSVVPILTEPNEYLHKECNQVTEFDGDLENLVQNLLDTVRDARDPEGAGLAAPQIGVLKRVCIARDIVDSASNNGNVIIEDRVLINPVLIKSSHEKDIDWEGCLSIPDTYALVERPNKIKIETYDVQGKKFQLKAKGFFARVIQHEMDHLDGKLITDSDRLIGKTLTQKEFDNMVEQKANM